MNITKKTPAECLGNVITGTQQVLGTSGKELQEDPGEWERITFFHPFHHFTQRQLCYAKAHWLGRLEPQTIRSRKSL